MRTFMRTALFALVVSPLACAPGSSDPGTEDVVGANEEEIRICAGGATQKGIDVSEHNGVVNWTKVKAAGTVFAVARVSDGLNHPDSKFATNWAGIKSAGLVRGVYQYFRPGQSAVGQADLLLSKIGTLGEGDLAPVIDVETANGQSLSTVVAGVRAWIDRVKEKTGRDPIIYAAAGFWDTLPNTAQFSGNVLWVANYQAQCPFMPKTWDKWAIWQHSESGSVSGISGAVDLNVFNGSLDQLKVLAGGAKPPCASDMECSNGAVGVGVVCSNTGVNAGKCIDGCHGDEDCPAGGTCDKTTATWQCTNAPPKLGTACTTDAQCSGGAAGTGRVCGSTSKQCIVGCHDTAADCPSGSVCNKTGPAWVCKPSTLPLGAACGTDAECGLPGEERVCSASSHKCIEGCHLDSDCPSGQACDHGTSPWQCNPPKPPPAPGGCPALTYPSGVKIQTVPNAAMTASYTGHLKAGETAPTCFLDVTNLKNPDTNQKYDIHVKVAAHFELDELVGTEVAQGWGNFVLVKPEAVAALEEFRVTAGKPVIVNSGFRGPKHQEAVCVSICGEPLGCPGLCSNNSRHMWGDAFDLPLSFYSDYYSDVACDAGFKFSYLEAGTHLHVDQNPAYAQCVQQ